MEPLPPNFSARARELLLDLVWRQWTLLGVAGHGGKEPNWTVDVEALVLVSTTYGRSDPRLFDEMLDWLWGNAQWVNVQRLRNIRKRLPLGDAHVLMALADWLSQRATLKKWAAVMKESPPVLYPEPLFRLPDGREIAWQGQSDPTFGKYGLMRGVIERREMSRPPHPRAAAVLPWKLRSLFGVQARCEFLLWLLTHERGHPAEIARATYYFPRTVEDTLREFAASGLVRSAVAGRVVSYWVQPGEWLFLRSWDEPRGFPRWIDWPRLFHVQDRLITIGGAKDMSPLLRASELRREFEALLPELEVAGLRTAFAASRDDRGVDFTTALQRDFELLYSGF